MTGKLTDHLYSIIRVLFALGMVCVFGYVFYASRDYMKLAKYFPLYTSLFFLVLSLIQLVQEIRIARGAVMKTGPKKADLASDWDIPMNQVLAKALQYFAYFLVFYVLIYLVGLRLAAVIGLFLIYRIQIRYSTAKSIIVALCGWAFLIGIAQVLAVKIPRGLLHEFVELPKMFF